jgi:phytoene dehydrogenase-like protein
VEWLAPVLIAVAALVTALTALVSAVKATHKVDVVNGHTHKLVDALVAQVQDLQAVIIELAKQSRTP